MFDYIDKLILIKIIIIVFRLNRCNRWSIQKWGIKKYRTSKKEKFCAEEENSALSLSNSWLELNEKALWTFLMIWQKICAVI